MGIVKIDRFHKKARAKGLGCSHTLQQGRAFADWSFPRLRIEPEKARDFQAFEFAIAS